jgi:hypothetical protein
MIAIFGSVLMQCSERIAKERLITMKRILAIAAMMMCMRDLRADCPGGSAATGWSVSSSCTYEAKGFTVDNTGNCSGSNTTAVGFELPSSESIDSDTKVDYQFSCSAG